MDLEKTYLTLTETAERLACSTRTVLKKLESGELSGNKFHNRWSISGSSVEAYLNTLSPEELATLETKRYKNSVDFMMKNETSELAEFLRSTQVGFLGRRPEKSRQEMIEWMKEKGFLPKDYEK